MSLLCNNEPIKKKLIIRYQLSVSVLKAHCLEYIQNVKNFNTHYIVTKRDIPVAKLVPIENKEEGFSFGRLKGTMTIKGDILAPIPVDWEENL
jgi:antitoxin (DNA-binding transcriptional repressor) of toxin-antitoxin stability system